MNRSNVLKLFVLLIVGFWATTLYLNQYSFIQGDGFDYAQIARNIASGEGTITKTYEYSGFKKGWPLPHTEVSRRPFYLYIMAAFMKIFGSNNFTVIFTSSLFYSIALLLTWYLSRQFLDKYYSMIVVLLLALNPVFLSLSISGRPETLFTCIFIIFLWTLTKYNNNNFILYRALSYSLLVLTRKIGFFFFPLLFWRPRSSGLNKVKPILSLVIIYLSLIGFSHILQPRPFTSLVQLISGTESYIDKYQEGENIDYGFSRNLEYASTHIFEIIKKWLIGIRKYYNSLPSLINPWVLGFMIFGFFSKNKNNKWTDYKKIIAISFFLAIIGIPLFSYRAGNRYFIYFVPLIIIIAVNGFKTVFVPLLDKYNKDKKNIVFGFLLLLILYPIIWDNLTLIENRILNNEPIKNFDKQFALFVNENIEDNSIVFTNNENLLAWYCDNYAVLIPTSYNSFYELDGHIDADYIAISNYLTNWDYEKTPEILTNLVQNKEIPKGYELFANYKPEEYPKNFAILYKKKTNNIK